MATGAPSRVSTALDPSVLLSKVPEVTVLFWVTKVLTTGMGETASDFLVRRIDPFVAVGLGAVAFVVAMALQLRARRYVPWTYWLAVSMVSVFGTMAADVVHIALGVPYAVSTVVFAVVLAAVFVVWYRTEGTLSIHSIRTRRRELFYWLTVLTTFALGTAAGDLTASTMDLGYFASGVLFAVVIAVPAVAHRRLGLNAITAFWFAYIVTRPLGASFADWLGVPHSRRGLDLGTGPVTLTLALVIAVLVGYLTVTHSDTPAEDVLTR
jgi:uncharacterized membrane-anchored protein